MDADDLYGVPLDRFTAERNALAKELRARGEREEAARVGAARKPSAPVWAINQAVRAHPGRAREMIEAGDRLRDAQRRLVRGGDPAALRDANADERDAVESLARLAVAALGAHVATATVDRIRDTLHAIATDADLHEPFLRGAISGERQRVGFGEFPDLTLVPRRERPAKADAGERRAREAADARRRERDERVAALRAELAAAEDEAADLERRARNARRRADALKSQITATDR